MKANNCVLVGLVVSICLISTSLCFLLDDPSHCVWYGECGKGWNGGKLNCPANSTTRQSPLMKDPEGLRIIRDLCPSLYNGDSNTRTCCDVHQLRTIERNMDFPKRFLGHCPACYFNFLNQVCQMTCSPRQSEFVWADMGATKPSSDSSGIPAVNYVITRDYANGLFDSCVEVETFARIKAIGFLCGRKAPDCTPENWLAYMGSLSNGRAPFPINYVYTDGEPWTAPDGEILQPLDIANARCNKPINTSSTTMGKTACACKECQASQPCIPDPHPTSATRKTYFDRLFRSGHYERVEIIVHRTDSQTIINHQLPPPSVESVNFTSIFEKQFLYQVLDLQNAIANITTSSGGATVSLDDVCLKLANQQECVIESVLQYYQNNVTNIEKVAYDQYGIFSLADYLDHFSQCVTDPSIGKDLLPYHMSCNAAFGGVIHPYIVLEGYTGNDDYPNATGFVITFLLKHSQSTTETQAWKQAFTSFMQSYNNPNMTITHTP